MAIVSKEIEKNQYTLSVYHMLEIRNDLNRNDNKIHRHTKAKHSKPPYKSKTQQTDYKTNNKCVLGC